MADWLLILIACLVSLPIFAAVLVVGVLLMDPAAPMTDTPEGDPDA